MMLPMSRLYPLVDRILDGHLADQLAEWRANGWSFQQIADELRDVHQVRVSDETVRGWCSTDGPKAAA